MRSPRSLAAAVLSIALLAAACGDADDSTDRAAADTDAADADTDGGAETATDGGTATTLRSSGTVEDSTSVAPTTASPTTTEAPADATPTVGPEPGGCRELAAGTTSFTTDAGGPMVSVDVFVPPSFDGEPLPAVLDFHGLGSNGVQQSLLTGYRDLARSEGFIAVHPSGADASWELAQFDAPGRDDLAMADDLIDTLVTEHCVDPARVYSTGMSNGGFFTALLVCERADRIAAATSVAGVSHPDGCEPSRPVPFAAYHGTDDTVVRFEGGPSTLGGGSSSPLTADFFDQSMPEEFAEFAADFGCGAEPEEATIADDVIRYDYLGCDDGIPVTFFEVAGGGHTWPGSPLGPVLTGALGRTTDSVDATADGWAFMREHTLPGA